MPGGRLSGEDPVFPSLEERCWTAHDGQGPGGCGATHRAVPRRLGRLRGPVRQAACEQGSGTELRPAAVHGASPSSGSRGTRDPAQVAALGRGWRSRAPDSPEESVPALGLVGEADEGVHGFRPEATCRPEFSRESARASPGPLGRSAVSPPPWGRARFPQNDFAGFRWGPEVVVTKATPRSRPR